ncbi:hypothetical protein [Thalassomonas haliotis]|uniref:Uncharacterized protein n=1 Tax=Thalassomonas haliotis TaxID=485448 RepID=A0ABY7VAN8_9GAMM|nr:hypothetical protein [Thalassomonas haliotis]WDE10447.1 hypothetical protein H3N35_19535 [Thalassomonas haliotis]
MPLLFFSQHPVAGGGRHPGDLFPETLTSLLTPDAFLANFKLKVNFLIILAVLMLISCLAQQSLLSDSSLNA